MRVNDTSEYYRSGEPSLFYEITISQCLSHIESPYTETLFSKKTFGYIVSEFLKSRILPPKIVVECGGGYGSLMKDFLKHFVPDKVFMVDISGRLLNIQRESLKNFKNVEFVNANIFDFLADFGENIDIFICNEVMGDLETITDIKKSNFKNIYSVDLSYLPEIFNFNSGAVKLLEFLNGKVSAAFLSEHSSTYTIPEKFKDILEDEKKDFSPRRIELKGHAEYTVNFQMLAEIAEKMGFNVYREHFLDFLPLKKDKLVEFVLSSKSHQTELHEIIFEFYNHVKEYEFLFLQR